MSAVPCVAPPVVPTASPLVSSGVCHGTLGELFQGPMTRHGERAIALVSFPVDRHAWAYFTPDGGSARPRPAFPKSARAVELFLWHYGIELPAGTWSTHSELTVGVGMASSTADIVATLRCLFRFTGIRYDQAVVIKILAAIERADSVFLDEFALYLSARHEVVRTLGARVGFHTCFVSAGAAVDTAGVTPLLLEHYAAHDKSYVDCLGELLAGFSAGDHARIARASTHSATLSQKVLPKDGFAEVLAQRRRFGADGIFVAHTGSLLGYLFRRRPSRVLMDELSSFFRMLGMQCSFASGGFDRA
ncbi:hypothetical protein NLX83_23185 [Allokutzneria sp. A3M-2-11 16]|uniref:GHMP family kinase ATP-binding protein n=1 Tax=Allokutzneria sp. A3M-2-11 16 TaxID=2962043 RepID=UPI0020B89453|nr:hypothetical protein [Allokutzneria sp. A3M-2-11 16]MCP3802176.1 hypothetical protein [Allokutzneria sp. A3M-2-11 16]